MACERIGIEAYLGVETTQLPVLRNDQRIDLQHLHVIGGKGGIETFDQRLRLFGQVAAKPERSCNRAAMMRHDAGRGIDGEGDDFLRRVVRDLLDIHAALGGHHERDAAGGAVDEKRQVELLVDFRAFFDIDAVDLLAGRTCLNGHQRVAKHFDRVGADVDKGFSEANAALGAWREVP